MTGSTFSVLSSRPARRTWLMAGAVVVWAIATASACSAGGGSTAPNSDAVADAQPVAVKLFQFDPSTVEITAGTEVVWTNGDDTVHEPTSGTPGAITPTFDVNLDGVDATGAHTFDEPGTYAYFCQLHTSMTGTIVVR